MVKSNIYKNTSSYHDSLIESLKTPEEANAYLQVAIEEYQNDDNKEAFLIALRNIAEAKGGISKLAKTTHLNRQALYNTLSKKGNPTLFTLGLILKDLGYKLAIEPNIDVVTDRKLKKSHQLRGPKASE